ncbi:hypothetical protein EPUL_001720 [Erysiphe pulchra]|uniref:Amine oxidase n=1 Tax=Erysiphe pulchra TaxID=225359 RepID=A0A2S4PZY0_9PEZI|nr:hypothetical protein EPUL_001720 [Erysiphe pulchra]
MPIVDFFISWILLSYVVSTHFVLGRRELKENGYDCGGKFFDDQMIHNELKKAFSDEGRKILMPYSGPLYSSTLSCAVWPILPLESPPKSTKYSRQNPIYQLVFDENGKVIDVIVKLANKQFAKCWRVDKQQSEASINSVVESNGYECGPEFIPDTRLAEIANIARHYLGTQLYYPLKYKGNLYSKELRYEIWPINYRTLVFPRHPITPRTGSIYIVIDLIGQLKDVIARTSDKNHIRCMRARKVSPAPDNDEPNQILDKPTRKGYVCKDEFFDDIYLSHISRKFRKQGSFPKLRYKLPDNTLCSLWPLNKIEMKVGDDRVDELYLALATNFRVKDVVMQLGEDLVPCKREVIAAGSPDNLIFRYNFDDFSRWEIAKAAAIARKKNRYYPY